MQLHLSEKLANEADLIRFKIFGITTLNSLNFHWDIWMRSLPATGDQIKKL